MRVLRYSAPQKHAEQKQEKDPKMEAKVGMTARELIAYIAHQLKDYPAYLRTLCFTKYLPSANIENPETLPPERLLKQGGGTSFKLESENLPNVILELPETTKPHAIGITSGIPRQSWHIPLMDFRCKPSPENLHRVTKAIREIQDKLFYRGDMPKQGFVLESGRSYHYYGCYLMDTLSWNTFLGMCLLLSDLTDARYIGHSLIDSSSTLRISATPLRPQIPKVVAIAE